MIFHTLTPEATKNWTKNYQTHVEEVNSDIDDGSTSSKKFEDDRQVVAESEDLSLRVSMSWRDWLTEPQFYQVSNWSFNQFLAKILTISFGLKSNGGREG